MRYVALLAVAMAACSGSPTEPSPTPLSVPLDGANWQTFSEPQPITLSNQGGALTFNLPTEGSINYLFTPSALAAIRGTIVVSINITTSGPVVFNSLDPQTTSCTIPTSVRPFIWSNSNGEGAFDRWWSNPRHLLLAAGTATVSVPLQPEFWSSVNGRLGNADPDTKFNFEKALLNVTRLGLTFGGGCSFGHGVNVRAGTASFALSEYTIR